MRAISPWWERACRGIGPYLRAEPSRISPLTSYPRILPSTDENGPSPGLSPNLYHLNVTCATRTTNAALSTDQHTLSATVSSRRPSPSTTYKTIISFTDTTMMGSTIMILFSLTAMSMVCDNVFAGMPTQCNPGYLDDLPPRIRKVCAALSRMYEFGPEIESYVEEKQSHIPGFHESIPLLDSGVKRQDVDHVFLRFGRRR